MQSMQETRYAMNGSGLKGIRCCNFGIIRYSPLTLTLSPRRLWRNWGNGEKCHAELVSASNKIKELRDPETSSG